MEEETAYNFIHTYDHIENGNNKGLKYPLWFVAQDPFSDIETDKEGHVIHLGCPRFTAKWYMGEEPYNPTDTLSGLTYNHPDLNISLCEVVFLDDTETDEETELGNLLKWFFEACCAVAHYKGDLAEAEQPKQ